MYYDMFKIHLPGQILLIILSDMNETQLCPVATENEVIDNNQPKLLVFSIDAEAWTMTAMNEDYQGASKGQENKASNNEKITIIDIALGHRQKQ